MICPKCGFEQPEGVECMRCGVIISRYKGPVAGAGARNTPPPFAPGATPPPLPPSFIPPPPVIAGGGVHAPTPPPLPPPLPVSPAESVYGEAPASPAGGTVYSGPPPPPAGSGTVYGGQGSVAPAFSSFPVFHGTFEAGKVLSEIFSIYVSNLIPFLLLSALVLSPAFLLSSWSSSLPASDPMAALGNSLALLLQFFCAPIATAAITYGVYQQMRSASPSIGACLQVGLATLFPLIGLAIVQGCGVALASLACLVPGIILSVRWAVAVPAKVEERAPIGDALSRSSFLTEGFRWQVFGILCVLGAIYLGLLIILALAFGVGSKTQTHSVLFQFASGLLGVLNTALSATASAVMYYRLRSVKEAIDVDQISSVFS